MRLEIFISMLVVIFGLSGSAQARPSYATDTGNSCSGCHDNHLTGRMEVTGEDTTIDLGTQLNDKVRGPLKAFVVEAGRTVSMSINVLDGTEKFGVQLKRLETSGQEVSLDNFLIWVGDNAVENPWTRQEVENPPYFTKDDGANGGLPAVEAGIFTFDLFVASGTPPDVYDLELAVAGNSVGDGKWYQDEHFYLEVLDPTEQYVGCSFPIDAAGQFESDFFDAFDPSLLDRNLCRQQCTAFRRGCNNTSQAANRCVRGAASSFSAADAQGCKAEFGNDTEQRGCLRIVNDERHDLSNLLREDKQSAGDSCTAAWEACRSSCDGPR
jgi:hypothetical protein